MKESQSARDVTIVVAAAFLLLSFALVATGPRPACRPAAAREARTSAQRSGERFDFSRAAQLNVDAARFTLGCTSLTTSRTGLEALGPAARSYAQSRMQYALTALSLGQTRLLAAASAVRQQSRYANPYAALIEPIDTAIARATSAGRP